LIDNHHIEKLPGIDQLWAIGTDQAHERYGVKQGDFGVDNVELPAIIDDGARHPGRGRL
jgi:hypothetical protein